MYFPSFLILGFIISLLLCYLSLNERKSAMEIVNNMGLGWNLAHTFDCSNINQEFHNPDEQIMNCGNMKPTKELFTKLKKYGFKTIRFPVTWMHFMDSSGKVNSEFMERVKEVVDWIINCNLFCILNVHNNGEIGNWLSEGVKVKGNYIALLKQIAEEFKDYDEYLIFESMNFIIPRNESNYDYTTLQTITQSFVDTIRNSGGNNKHRLLLISGADKDFDLTISEEFQMPIDPSNKLGVSINYYIPAQFTLESEDSPITWIDEYGVVNIVTPMSQWGSEDQYKDMFTNFETMKKTFIDKGIPIILSEVGVLTEDKKEIESIREYLYADFSMSSSYEGIISCLWDTSNSRYMSFYDRFNDKWYDQIIKDNFKKISKGKYINPQDYYFISNKETKMHPEEDGSLFMKFGTKKVLKIIFNAFISITPTYNTGFGITSIDKDGFWIGEGLSGELGKRQYDGSYTFTIDASKKDFHDYIRIEKWWGNEFISLNYLNLEYEKAYTLFDFQEYIKNFEN